jgi:outer membrane protein
MTSAQHPARPARRSLTLRFTRFTRFTGLTRLTRLRTLQAALPAALVVLLGAALPAQAQSLRELYEAARLYDATVLAARAQAASAEHRVARTEALLGKPSATVTGSATGTVSDPAKLATGDIRTVQGTLNGRLPIFNKANASSIEQSKRSLQSAAAELEAVEQGLAVRVAVAYFDVLAARDSLATTRANKAAVTETLASAKRAFEVGTATITDTREAQARFDLVSAQELAAENNLRTAQVALDTLVGRPNVQPLALAVPVALPGVMPAAVEEWVNQAEAQHPSIRIRRTLLEIAKLEIERVRAADSPTLDAVGSAGLSHSSGKLVALPGVSKTASLGVQLTWPIWNSGATDAGVREAVLLEDKARNDLEATRRVVAQDTRTVFFNVNSGLAQVKALEAAEASSKLSLEAAQLAFRVGVRVNLDVLNAQTQLFQTQRDLARARYDVIVGGLRLRQASGQLTAGDVDAANRLLAVPR